MSSSASGGVGGGGGGGRRGSRGSTGVGERGLKEKFKSLFGSRAEADSSGDWGSSLRARTTAPALQLSQDKLRMLSGEFDQSMRLKQMAALQTLVQSKRLEPSSLEALWQTIRDLAERSSRQSPSPLPSESRASLLVFLRVLAQSQLGNGPATEVLRNALFQCFQDSSPTDFGEGDVAVLELVSALTEEGRTGVGVDGMGRFVVAWSEAIIRTVPVCSVPIPRWLAFLSHLVEWNLGAVEKDEAERLVHLLCVHASSCARTAEPERVEEIRGCLDVLDRILRFSVFPRPLVHVLVTTLCKLVNSAALSELSWLVMRDVLSSYLGYTCVLRLCALLEAAESEAPVLQGAVFFLAMGLWGSKRVHSLFYSPVAVLNSLRLGLRSNSLSVTYEVLISIRRLVEKYGKELQHLSWNGILEILDDIRKSDGQTELSESEERLDERVRELFHLILDSMEALAERNTYSGNPGQLYALIESCSAQRSETSILRLLTFRAKDINAQCPSWIQDLRDLLWNYYFQDGRATVRIKVVNILRASYRCNRHLHDAALLQQVILPILRNLPQEPDADVTRSGLALLADISKETHARIMVPDGPRDEPSSVHSFRDAFLEIMDIFQRLLHSGLQAVRPSSDLSSADDRLLIMDNLENAVKLLIQILRTKWRVSPAYHSLHVLRLLAKTLSIAYSVGLVEELGSAVRERIVLLLVRLRANPASTRIGILFPPPGGLDDHEPRLDVAVEENPYLFCHDPALGVLHYHDEGSCEREMGMEWSWIADSLLGVIQQERVWRVLDLLLLHLPELLKNRALILSTPPAIPDITNALTHAAVSTTKVHPPLYCKHTATPRMTFALNKGR